MFQAHDIQTHLFFTWMICTGQHLASRTNTQLPFLQRENKLSAFTVGFKFARDTQPDTKGQKNTKGQVRKAILYTYRSFWDSTFSSQKKSDPLIILRNAKFYQYASLSPFLILNVCFVLPAVFTGPWGILKKKKGIVMETK